MLIAKIIGSNSHIDYVGRIVDDPVPDAADHGFAQFVSLKSGAEETIGVIYDSKLVNPEFAAYGPRLSPKPALERFTQDNLNKQSILIGVLLLGVIDGTGRNAHGVPKRIVPAGEDVTAIGPAAVKRFHEDADGNVRLHYYPQVVSHTGPLAIPLLEAIIEQIEADCSATDRQRLDVLKQSLVWQRTIGGNRL